MYINFIGMRFSSLKEDRLVASDNLIKVFWPNLNSQAYCCCSNRMVLPNFAVVITIILREWSCMLCSVSGYSGNMYTLCCLHVVWHVLGIQTVVLIASCRHPVTNYSHYQSLQLLSPVYTLWLSHHLPPCVLTLVLYWQVYKPVAKV